MRFVAILPHSRCEFRRRAGVGLEWPCRDRVLFVVLSESCWGQVCHKVGQGADWGKVRHPGRYELWMVFLAHERRQRLELWILSTFGLLTWDKRFFSIMLGLNATFQSEWRYLLLILLSEAMVLHCGFLFFFNLSRTSDYCRILLACEPWWLVNSRVGSAIIKYSCRRLYRLVAAI
jgi:hypothetical protein